MTRPAGLLVLVRHGQSTDNELNLFSGWRDPPLTARGVEEAREAGRRLKELGLGFDVAFTSLLERARHTLTLMLVEMDQSGLPTIRSEALNERDYGDLSGLNKEEARSVWGSEQVHLWRKSYDAVPPGGESLAMTAARMLPFWQREIDPRVLRGERVLVVAHGNSLRSIVKHLDGLAGDDIVGVHIATSEILAYSMREDGRLVRSQLTATAGACQPTVATPTV